jgi:AcrR family transcriptional regulator
MSALTRQQEKTRAAIRAAFVSLLFERNYPSVTMANVADRANVGRSTLYEHFRTKLDLLKDSATVPFSGMAGLVDDAATTGGLINLLHHFRENHALARVLVHMPARAGLDTVLSQLIEQRLTVLAGGQSALIPLPLAARQIAAAQFALLEPWVLAQVAIRPDILGEALVRTTRALVGAIFNEKGPAATL